MLGDTIKKLRLGLDLSSTELAKIAGVDKTYLNKIEKNERTNPSFDIITSICKALNISMDEFQTQIKIDEDTLLLFDIFFGDKLYEKLVEAYKKPSPDHYFPEVDLVAKKKMIENFLFRTKFNNDKEYYQVFYKDSLCKIITNKENIYYKSNDFEIDKFQLDIEVFANAFRALITNFDKFQFADKNDNLTYLFKAFQSADFAKDMTQFIGLILEKVEFINKSEYKIYFNI